MKSNLLMDFSVDKNQRKIIVKREFAAPVANVWAAWTQSELLDQWWAPKPWTARTKSMEFHTGGMWLYAMVGPDGTEHWSRAEFTNVVPQQQFTGTDRFCDRDGNIDMSLPLSTWNVSFSSSENGTLVTIENNYNSVDELEQILAMGFEEGFTAGLNNLDHLLEMKAEPNL